MSKFFHKLFRLLITICILILPIEQAVADNVLVAVASNFADAIRQVADRFEEKTGHKIIVIPGSTGKHYAQIMNGAPFDLFFAADVKRAKLLEEEGIAQSGSRFTYAIGTLVLWSLDKNYVDSLGRVIKEGDFRHLVIANPKLAPYGRAAQEVLQYYKIWSPLSKRIVRGENIGQTFQFINSGNAKLGFVAYSQIKWLALSVKGSFWKVPQSLYSPIEQQAVLLNDRDSTRAFLSFMKSDESLEIIRGFGYGTS